MGGAGYRLQQSQRAIERCVIDNAHHELQPEMFATVTVANVNIQAIAVLQQSVFRILGGMGIVLTCETIRHINRRCSLDKISKAITMTPGGMMGYHLIF